MNTKTDELRARLPGLPAHVELDPRGAPLYSAQQMCDFAVAALSAAPVEAHHAWRADPDAEGWMYCPQCDCSRLAPDGGLPEITGCPGMPGRTTPPIAALAPHSGGEGDAFPEIENLIDECMDAGAKTYFFNVTQRMPPGVEWMPFPNVARKKLLDAIRRLATPTPQAAGVSEKGAFHVVEKSPYIDVFSDDFTHDVALRVSGDFATKAEHRRYAEWVASALNTAAGAAPEGWQAKAHELLDRLAKASPPNVLHQQLTILGDMAALLRCMYPQQPGAQEKA